MFIDGALNHESKMRPDILATLLSESETEYPGGKGDNSFTNNHTVSSAGKSSIHPHHHLPRWEYLEQLVTCNPALFAA